MNSQKQAASETINILKSKLEVAERLSDEMKHLKEEPSFMTEEEIREEEIMTFENLRKPKQIIEEVEILEKDSDYLGPNRIKNLEVEIKKNTLKRKEKISKDASTGCYINVLFNFFALFFITLL